MNQTTACTKTLLNLSNFLQGIRQISAALVTIKLLFLCATEFRAFSLILNFANIL